MKKLICSILIFTLLALVNNVVAEDEDLAKQAQNPIADLISLHFKMIPILTLAPITVHKMY